MERKIGEIFWFNDKLYKVVETASNVCKSCAFDKLCDKSRENVMEIAGDCSSATRADKSIVMFKMVEDTEIKDNEIAINIPDGMEIDAKSSDLKNGIIKFKKKDITYKDIQDSVGKYPTSDYITPQNRFKLHAIDMLMNIAKYYNKDWKPDWSNIDEPKFFILYDNRDERYIVDCNTGFSINAVYFKHKEDALAVIYNPNFREILDAIFKN